jgi:hypothetical protein
VLSGRQSKKQFYLETIYSEVRPWKGVMPGSDPVEVGEQRMKRHQIIKEEV